MNEKTTCNEKLEFDNDREESTRIFQCELSEGHSGLHKVTKIASQRGTYTLSWDTNKSFICLEKE